MDNESPKQPLSSDGCEDNQSQLSNIESERTDGNELQLKPFQIPEIEKGISRKRMGIVWEPGLGKTCGTATICASLSWRKWLIFCPDNALSMWGGNPKYEDLTAIDWVKRLHPDATVKVEIITGLPDVLRKKIWESPWDTGKNKFHFRIVTLETFHRDWSEIGTPHPGKKKRHYRFAPKKNHFMPEVVIFDEAKKLRNKDAVMTKTFTSYMTYYPIQGFLPLTGTPGHEPRHFFSLLHIIDPRFFSSYWKFIRAFHQVDDGPFGLEINEPRNLPQWYNLLGRYFSVLREDDPMVLLHRPKMSRQLLDITMDDDQRRRYTELSEEMMTWIEQDENMVAAQNDFAIITRLRQVLICPAILSPSLSAGAAIADFADREDPGTPIVIFTPYTSAFEHFEKFLRSKGFEHIFTFQGGMGTPERDNRLEQFRRTRGVAICSVLYAQAFSFEPATRAYFIGYDWDPDNNRQAEYRLQRLTQPVPCMAYYYTFRSTFDERLCQAVNLKQTRVNITIPANIREYFK